MTYKGFELISADELTNLEVLKSKILYSDTIEELSFARQKDIYNYCRLNAMHEACLENLNQIRYAVTRIYFDEKDYYPYIGKICPCCEAEPEKKPKIMDDNDIHEFEFALFEFVKKASQKDATAEEVEALPAVAKVLMDLLGLGRGFRI